MRLAGKKAIVTGGSSGIGKAIAIAIAAEGANVVISYNRNSNGAIDTLDQIKSMGMKAAAFPLNLDRIDDAIHNFVDQSFCEMGGIDILVNNAGLLTRIPFLNVNSDDLINTLSTNLVAPFFLCQEVASKMIEANTSGSIINVSSISDRITVKGLSHYQCSKAGLSMLTRGAAFELASYGIRVNSIAPGLTSTNLNLELRNKSKEEWQQRSSEVPLQRAGVPQDHVGAVIFLASEESSWLTGTCITIDGGRTLI